MTHGVRSSCKGDQESSSLRVQCAHVETGMFICASCEIAQSDVLPDIGTSNRDVVGGGALTPACTDDRPLAAHVRGCKILLQKSL